MSKSLAAEYQSQPWIMEPEALKAFAERLAGLPESALIYAIKIEKKKVLNVTGGIARIHISGYLLDKVPDWMVFWGIEATGYDRIKEQVDEAAERSDVMAIELIVDSPGGMVSGVISAADAIYNARSKKPVTAIVNNLSASAAYWLTSQAEKITASDVNVLVGAIGVYTWYADWSKFEEKMGVKVIVVRSGEHKGMGIDSITDSQIAAVQEYIDDTAGNFIDAVARGRGAEREKISEIATGKIWIALKARGLGLIDSVTRPVTLQSQAIETQTKSKGILMEENDQQVNAQIADNDKAVELQKKTAVDKALSDERDRINRLNTEFADDPAFANKAIGEGWDVQQAKAEYADVLRERLKEKNNQSSVINHQSGGSEPLASGDTDDGAGGDFIEQARAMAAEKKISLTAAMKKLRRSNPELHQAYLQKMEESGRAVYNEVA